MSNTTAPAFLDNPIILDISSSYGAILIGIFFSSILYGVSSLQSFIYSLNCEKDSVYMKALVATLWVADTGNQITLWMGAWPVLVKQYGRIAGLSDVQPAIMHHVWVSHIVIFTVQMYLARRIYLFGHTGSKSIRPLVNIFIAVMIPLASFELIGVIVYEIRGYGKSLNVLSSPFEVHVNMALRGVACSVDISLAMGMMYLLKRTSPHFKRSQQLLQRLLIITVGSGTLTALAAIGVLIAISRAPNDLWYCIFDFPLCSLYFSTLLVNINARNYIKNGKVAITNFSAVTDSTLGPNSSALKIHGMNKQGSDMLVKIQSETNIKMDDMESFGRGSR